ncbi:hypothetical protein [Gorillibacterium sp. CAU 1737]|uniref:hypothetical protein n=1 Tax=Gorillibacterium sp. CAU 1737 TaxID=3140362 RepID=UPI003261AA47
MAICIEFELVEVNGSTARYRFGECCKELTALFEVDLEKLLSGETSWDSPMDKVVVLLNDGDRQSMANRAFSKIFKHYKETGEYLSKGGYYA